MQKLIATAAALALTLAAPATVFAAAQADGAFTLANVAPPETPEPPATPAADPNAPAATEAPATPDATETPAAAEATTPPAEGTAPPEAAAPDAAASTEAPAADATLETTDAAAVTDTPAADATASGGMGMGTIIGILAVLAVAGGAGYWFMNRKA